MPLATDDILKQGIAQLDSQIKSVIRYRKYYDGDHPLDFASEKFRNAFGGMFKAFADNMCPSVVDALADRLQITGFESDTANDKLSEAAWNIWNLNRMDKISGKAHSEAIKTGNALVVVWPDIDSGDPRIFINGADVMTVAYEDSDQDSAPVWAMKVWKVKDFLRLNFYFPSVIEKYITANTVSSLPTSLASYKQFAAPGESWPVPNPYGRVPVFHLANNSGLLTWGRSELQNVIAVQDALNKTVMDMLVGSEYHALPQRYVIGLQLEIDPLTGQFKAPFKSGIDTLWTASNAETKFGEFSAADISKLLVVVDNFRLEIARVSRTPLHYIAPTVGGFPSGESLKTAEAPFVAKVRDRQVDFGNTWEDVMAFALRIAGSQETMLSALWTSAEPRSDKDQLENAILKKQAGVPQKQIWRELGYTEEQIAEFSQAADEEREAVGQRMMQQFNGGNVS